MEGQEHAASNQKAQQAKPAMPFKVKPIYGLALVVLILLGGIYMAIGGSMQTIASGDTVSVLYTGTLTNGTVFDSSSLHGNQPLQFVVGSGQLIKGFDQAVIGMKLNQSKTITLTPDQAYGQKNPSLIVQVPLAQFGNQTIKPGMSVTQTSGGAQAQGIITAVTSKNATVDFNSPLAGQTLIFKITVVAIKKK